MSQENLKNTERYFFRASAADFKKIPGSPIAYWASENLFAAFKSKQLRDVADAKQGMATSDNGRFLRLWHEVSIDETCFDCKSLAESECRSEKWYAYNKGGTFRRWFGNNEYVVNWHKNGEELRGFVEEINKLRPGGRLKNQEYYFLENITYSALSSGLFSARYNQSGFLFDTKGSCIFPKTISMNVLFSMLNSNVVQAFLNILCPTLDYSSIGINAIPVKSPDRPVPVKDLLGIAKADWDDYELSWDFSSLPLLHTNHHQPSLHATYKNLRAHSRGVTEKMQCLEQENNQIFIDAYGLQDELDSGVNIQEITLSCNPYYRYGGDKTDAELEAQLQADTIAEFLSYAVGCMFGRYSVDKPGLVLANQGDTLADYLRQVPEPRFMPDEDNVIPLLDGEWFADDVTERFRTFLRVTFGEQHYEDNLAFIEASLGKDVRKYFTKDFYTDHVKRYKKRPIYWLFASPKGTFSALIYLHRYRQDTVSVVLQYLRDFRKKLADELSRQQTIVINPNAEQAKKTKAQKAVEILKKQLLELDDYERDTLYPLATKQVQLNLDDGVKFNYLQLGSALKKITGLEAKED